MCKGKWKLKCRKGAAIIMMAVLLLGSVDGGMAGVFASETETTAVLQEKAPQTEVTKSSDPSSGKNENSLTSETTEKTKPSASETTEETKLSASGTTEKTKPSESETTGETKPSTSEMTGGGENKNR